MNGSVGNLHRVVIVNDHGGPEVIPGRLLAGTGDTVEFRSVNAGRVKLFFPTPILVDADGRAVSEQVVDQGGLVPLFVAKDIAAGSYPYMAYCEAVNDLARGGSQPKIIIYQ